MTNWTPSTTNPHRTGTMATDPYFDTRPEVISTALMATSLLVLLLVVVGAIVMGAIRGRNIGRCPASYYGWRCVHDEDHPGSHRDENNRYWN